MEQFKDILGYEDRYQISNLGRVFSKKTGIFLNTRPGKLGYPRVNLHNGKGYKTNLIHRLIGVHFIPNPNNYREINHIDGDRTNNSIENLEWVSRTDNVRHAIKTGLTPLGQDRKGSKLTDIQACEIYELSTCGLYKAKEIADVYGVSKTQVYQIKNKREWRHIHGY